MRLILASSSPIRRALLDRAGVPHEAIPARVDEESLRAALEAEGTSPRDMADALAEAKALKVAAKHPGALVLGCDQVLELDGRALGKAADRAEAAAQLTAMAGKTHRLHSAAVICEDGRPVWRHVGTVRLTMRNLSPAFLASYLDRNWPGVEDCVGAYKIEEEGVRLFARIDGGYFDVLGLPLLEVLGYLALRGIVET
jgi:septum formation protein